MANLLHLLLITLLGLTSGCKPDTDSSLDFQQTPATVKILKFASTESAKKYFATGAVKTTVNVAGSNTAVASGSSGLLVAGTTIILLLPVAVVATGAYAIAVTDKTEERLRGLRVTLEALKGSNVPLNSLTLPPGVREGGDALLYFQTIGDFVQGTNAESSAVDFLTRIFSKAYTQKRQLTNKVIYQFIGDAIRYKQLEGRKMSDDVIDELVDELDTCIGKCTLPVSKDIAELVEALKSGYAQAVGKKQWTLDELRSATNYPQMKANEYPRAMSQAKFEHEKCQEEFVGFSGRDFREGGKTFDPNDCSSQNENCKIEGNILKNLSHSSPSLNDLMSCQSDDVNRVKGDLADWQDFADEAEGKTIKQLIGDEFSSLNCAEKDLLIKADAKCSDVPLDELICSASQWKTFQLKEDRSGPDLFKRSKGEKAPCPKCCVFFGNIWERIKNKSQCNSGIATVKRLLCKPACKALAQSALIDLPVPVLDCN